MRGAAFSVGAGDVYAFELMLGIADAIAKCNGVVEIGFVCSSANSGEHGQLSKKVINGFLVIHKHKVNCKREKNNVDINF